MNTMPASHNPIFWRDSRMPHLELRKVADGRQVCYALHTHTHWSLGAITGGQSTFVYREHRYRVHEGALVLMNPEWPHACNPIDDQPWAYLMLYVDVDWISALRYELGLLAQPRWQDIHIAVLDEPGLYRSFCEMADCLLDPEAQLLEKQTKAVEYLSALMQSIGAQNVNPQPEPPGVLKALGAYLDQHCTEDLSLDNLCARTGYSPGHLIRAFKQYFGMTPHAYMINRRVQYGQRELKRGTAIADAALSTGFADQAHFQRTFKKLVAATPGQYRRASFQKY